MGQIKKPRICRVCGIGLTDENWALHQQKVSSHICRTCVRDNARRARAERAERPMPIGQVCRECGTELTDDNWQTANRIDGRAICRTCAGAAFAARYQANIEVEREKRRENNRRKRQQVIEMYGGKCACCEETEIEFLAIDHINGGGGAERKGFKGNTFYWHLAKTPKRDDLRVLCHNCNMAIGFYGHCPHERKRYQAAEGYDP